MEDNPDASENVFMSSDKSQGIVPSELNATKESLLNINKNDNSHKQNKVEDIQTTKVLASNIAETQRGYGKEKINKGNIFERKPARTSSQSQTSRNQDALIVSCKSHETATKYSEFGKQPVGANNSFTHTILEAVCQDFQNIGQESSVTSNNSISQPSNSNLCSVSKESCSQKSATSKKPETYISSVEKPRGSVVLENSTGSLGFSNVSHKTQIPVCEDIAVSCKPLGEDIQIVDNKKKSDKGTDASVSKECNINSKSNTTKKGEYLSKETSKTLHSCKRVTPESQTQLQISSNVEPVERSKSDELTSSSTTNKQKDIVNNVHNSVQTTGTVKGADVCSTGTYHDTNVQQITDVYSQLGIGFQMETVCENMGAGKTAAQPQTKSQNLGKRKYVWKNKHPSNFSKKNESIKARNNAGINKMAPEIRKTNSRRISAKMKRQWAEELKKEGHLTCQISGCYQRYVTVANFQTHFKWCTGKTNKGLQHCPYCDSLILADQDAALHHMEVEHPDKIEEYREKLAQKTPNKFPSDTSAVIETNVVKETRQDSKIKNQAISENIISKKLSKKYLKFKNQKNLNLSSKENLLKPKKTCLKQKLKALGKSVVSDFSKSKKCVRFNDIVQQINSVSSKPETQNDSEAAENIPTKLVKQKKKIRELPEDHIEVSSFHTVNAESTDYFDAVIDDPKVSEPELQLSKSDIVKRFGSKSRLLLNTKEYRRFTEFVIPTRDWASARKTYSRSRSSLLAESPLKKAVQPQEIIDMHQLQNEDAPPEITLNSSQEESLLELKNNVPADELEIPTSEPNVATSSIFASYSRNQNLRTKKLSKVATAGVAHGQNVIKNLISGHQDEFSKAGSNFPDKMLIGESDTVISAVDKCTLSSKKYGQCDTFISIDSQLALNSNERLKMQSDVLAASLSKETDDRSIISKSYPETPRTGNKGRITCYDNAYRQTSQRHTVPNENATLLGSTNSSNIISPCNNINQSHTLPAISASNYSNSVSTVSYTTIQTPKKRGRPRKNENINIPALQNSQEITDSELSKNVLQSANAIGKPYSHGVHIETKDISKKRSKAKVHVSRENGIKLPNECSCKCTKNVIKKKRGRPRKVASVEVTANSPNELFSGPHPANSNCKLCTCSKFQKVLKGVKSKKKVVSKHSITNTMKLKKKFNLSDESASSAFDLLTQTTEKPVRKRGRPRKNPLCDEMQLKGKTKVRSIQKAIKTGLTFVLDKACKYASHKGSHSKRYITNKQEPKPCGKECVNSNDLPDGRQSENINIIGSTDINHEIPVANLENICIKPVKVPKRGRPRKFVITNQITSENETHALENKEQEIEQLLNIDEANKDLLNETSSKVCEEPADTVDKVTHLLEKTADTVDKITFLLENNSDNIEANVLKHSQNVTSETCEVSEKFASVEQNVTAISEKDAPLSQTVEMNRVRVIDLSNYRPEQINSEFQTGRNILPVPDSYENQNETAVNMTEKISQLTAIKERKTLEIKSADKEREKISVQETLNYRNATEKMEGKFAVNIQNEVIAGNFSQTPKTVIISEIDLAAAPTEVLTTTLVDSTSINNTLSASEIETNGKSETRIDTLPAVDKFKNNETNSEALDERKTDCLNVISNSSKIVQEEGILDAEVKQSSEMDCRHNVENSLNASGEDINKVCVTTEELSSKLVSSVTVADGTEVIEKTVLRNDAFPSENETHNTHTVENKEQETEQLPNTSEVNKDLFNNVSSAVCEEPLNDISECTNINSDSKTVKEKSPKKVIEICTDSVQTTAKYISCENSEFLKSKDNLLIKKDEENTFLSVNQHDKLPETSNVITEEIVHDFDAEKIKIFNQSKLSSNNAGSPSIHQVCLTTDEVSKIAVVTLSKSHKQTPEANSSGVSNECVSHTEILKSVEVNISNETGATPKLNKRGRPRKNKAVKILNDENEGKMKGNAESHEPISCQSETTVLRFSERQRNRKLSLDGSVLSKSDDALCSKINSSHNTEITSQKRFRKSKKLIMDLKASDTQSKPNDKSDFHLSQSCLHQSGFIIQKSGKRGRPRKYPIEKVIHSDQSLLDSSTVKSLHINENASGEIKLNENKGSQTNIDETYLQQNETHQITNKQNSAYKSNSVTEEQTAVETDSLISSNKVDDPLATNTVRKCSRKGRPRKCSRYAQLNQSDNKTMPSDQIMDNSLKEATYSEDRKKITADQNISTKGEQNDLTNTVHNPQESVIEPNKPNNNVGQELNIQCSTVSGKKRKKHSSLEVPKKMKKNEEKDFHADKQKCVQNLAIKEKTETKIDVSHSRKSKSDVKIDEIVLDAEEKTIDKQEESKYSETETNIIGRKRKIVKRVSALISSSESNADEDSEPDKMNNETHSQVDRLSTKCKRKKEDVIANNDSEEEMVGNLEGSVIDLTENDTKNSIIQSKTKKLPTRQAAVKARKMLVNLMKLSKQPGQQENSSDSDYKEQDKSHATETESAEDEEEEDDDDEMEKDKILLPINKVEQKLEKLKDYFVAPKAFEKKKASPELFKKWNEDLDTRGKTVCENEGCGKALETLLGMKYHYENSPCLKIRSKWKCLLCDRELRPGPRTMYRHMCDVHFDLTPKIDNSKIKRNVPSGRKHCIKPGISEIKLAIDFHCKYKYENLMTEWKPKKVMWKLQDESEYNSYLPPLKTSPNIKIEDTKEEKEVPWFTLKCFESMSAKADSSHCTFFVGGSVWGSAWCPTPIDVKATQFIALATCTSMDMDHPLLSVDESKGLLQFWDVGVLQPNIQDNKPVLRLAISHNHGNIWDMAWCPSGCWEDPSTVCDTEDLPRLGLLAVACADSYIRIYSIPHPVSLNCDPNCLPIYCSWPVAVLHSPNGEPSLSSQRTMCTSVSWQRTDKCELIAGGFGNGMICIWHVTSSSSLLTKCHENAQKTILPYLSFHAHKASITSLDWAPLPRGRWIASSAFDADFKIWDLDDISLPLTTQEKVKQKKLPRSIQWKPHWCGLFAALDDCYTGSSSFYKECGYYNFPFRFLSCHNSCTWSISMSEWLNTEASGDAAGEVTGTILCHLAKNVKYTKQMYDRRIPIFRTELRCIEETTRSSIDDSERNSIASLPTSVSHSVLSECQAEISQIADADKETIKNKTDDLNDSILRAVNNYLPNTTLTVTKTNQKLTESNSEAKCKESRISRDMCVENDLQTEAEIVNSLAERTVIDMDSNNSKSIEELYTPTEIIEVVNNLAERVAVELNSNNSEIVELKAEIMEIVNDLIKRTVDSINVNYSKTVELQSQTEVTGISSLGEIEIVNSVAERAAVNGDYASSKTVKLQTEVTDIVNNLAEVVEVVNNLAERAVNTNIISSNTVKLQKQIEIMEVVNDLAKMVVSNMDRNDRIVELPTQAEIVEIVNNLLERAAINVNSNNTKTNECIIPVEVLEVINDLVEETVVHVDNSEMVETPAEIVEMVNDLTKRVAVQTSNCEMFETSKEIVNAANDLTERVAVCKDNFETSKEIVNVVNGLTERAAVHADNFETSEEIVMVVNDLTERAAVHADNFETSEEIVKVVNDLTERAAVHADNFETSEEIVKVVNDLTERAAVHADNFETSEEIVKVINDLTERAAVHADNFETSEEIVKVVNDLSERAAVHADNFATSEEIIKVVNDLTERIVHHVDNCETVETSEEIVKVVQDFVQRVAIHVDNNCEAIESTTPPEIGEVVNDLVVRVAVQADNSKTVQFIASTEILEVNDLSEKTSVQVDNSKIFEYIVSAEIKDDLAEKVAVPVNSSKTSKFAAEIMEVVNDISEKVTVHVDNSETDEFTTEVIKVINDLLEKASVLVTNRKSVEFIASTEIKTDNDHTAKAAIHVNNSETTEFTTEIVEVVNGLLEKAIVHVDSSETDVMKVVKDLLEKASLHVDNSETAEFIVPAEIKAVDLARKDTDNSETFAVDNKEALELTKDILKVVNDLTERAVRSCAESNNKVLTTPVEILEVVNNLAARAAIHVDNNEKVEFTASAEILDVVNDLTERTAIHMDSEADEFTSPTDITEVINDLVERAAAHVDSNSNETVDFTTPSDIRKILKNPVEKAAIHVNKHNSETTGFAAPAEIVEVVSELLERIAVCVNGGNNKSVKFKPPAEIIKMVNNIGEGSDHKDNGNSNSRKPIGFEVVTDVTDVVNDLVKRTSVMQESNAAEPQNAEKIVAVVNDLSESATVHEDKNIKTVNFETPAEITEVVNNLVKSIVLLDGVNSKLSEFKTSTEIMEGVNDLSTSVVCVHSNKLARCRTSEIIEVDNCSAENIDMVGSNNKSFNKRGVNDSPTFKDFGKDLSLTLMKPSEVSTHKSKKFQTPETIKRKGKFFYSSTPTLMDSKFPMMKPKISHVNHEVKIISEVINDILNTVEDNLHGIMQNALPPTEENHGNTMTIHNNFEQKETSRLCNSSVTVYGKESPATENTAHKNYPPAPNAIDFKQDSENIIVEVVDHLTHTASELAVLNSDKYNQCVEMSDSCHVKPKAISKCEYDKTVHAHEIDHNNFATNIGNMINNQFAENDETVIICNKERQDVSNKNKEKFISNELLDSVRVITSKNVEHNIPLTDDCINDNPSIVSVTIEKDFRPTEYSVNINNEIMTSIKMKHSNEQTQNVSSELMLNKLSNINRNNDSNDDVSVVQTLYSKRSEKRCEVVVPQAVDDVVLQLLDKCQEMFASHPNSSQESATMSTPADDPSIMQTPGEEEVNAVENCVMQEMEDFMVIDETNVQKSYENTVIGGEVTIRHEPVEAMNIEDEAVVRFEPAEAMVIDEETTVIRHEPDNTCVMLQESTKHAVVVSDANNRQESTEVMITGDEPGIGEKSADVIFAGNSCIRQGSIQPMVIETDITKVQEAVTENITINNQEISSEIGITKNKANQQEYLAQDIITGIRPSGQQEMSVNIPSLSDSAKNVLLSKTRQHEEVFSSNNVIKPTEESTIYENGVGTNSFVSDKHIGQDSAKNSETCDNFHEMSRKYGMVFKDTDLRDISKIPAEDSQRLRKSDLMNTVLPNEYPMASINCVKWNPNFGSHLWLFSVGHAGIARLSCVSGLNNPEAANILENSVKSHQNR